MKKSAILILLFILSGCTGNWDSNDGGTASYDGNLPYYKFIGPDHDYLIDSSLKKGKIITFRNQDDNTALRYKVKVHATARVPYTEGTFSGSGITYYYYDRQETLLEAIDPPFQGQVIRIAIDKTASGSVFGGFYFHLWNAPANGYFENQVGLYLKSTPSATFKIGDAVYNNVIMISSGAAVPYESDGFTRNVNKVWYDLNKGIIGFQDLDGHDWRLVK